MFNNLLDVATWFGQNWMLLVLIVLAVACLVPTYLRSKKEANNRNELNNSLVKGTKIVTTAGVYGVVESVENTTDGKVVTIITGNSKNPTTMTIHINAIMGIDNKTTVVEELDEELPKKVEKVEKVEIIDDEKESKEENDTTSTKITAKKTTKSTSKKPAKKENN